MAQFITMISDDMVRCLKSLRLCEAIVINGINERGIVNLKGTVKVVEALEGTDPPCWRITITDSCNAVHLPPSNLRFSRPSVASGSDRKPSLKILQKA